MILAFLEQLILNLLLLVKKYPAVRVGTQEFITVFAEVLNWTSS
jgi:hypothetical protein